MFLKRPSYNPYRVLVDRSPDTLMAGEDVFALQTALNAFLGTSLTLDGVCGPKTGAQIWKAQGNLGGLVIDGKAGVVTQRALSLNLLNKTGLIHDLSKLGQGQLEHESSYLLGNYSPQRPDGGWDAGIVQLNTLLTPPSTGFNVPKALMIYRGRIEKAWISYSDTSKFVGPDKTALRRLKLAGGYWNAPAYANWLAGVGDSAEPSPTARETLETYMTEVSVYV